MSTSENIFCPIVLIIWWCGNGLLMFRCPYGWLQIFGHWGVWCTKWQLVNHHSIHKAWKLWSKWYRLTKHLYVKRPAMTWTTWFSNCCRKIPCKAQVGKNLNHTHFGHQQHQFLILNAKMCSILSNHYLMIMLVRKEVYPIWPFTTNRDTRRVLIASLVNN